MRTVPIGERQGWLAMSDVYPQWRLRTEKARAMIRSQVSPAMRVVDQDTFRDAISRFATGVTVVTTFSGGRDHGTTVSAITSLSLEPPMLLICLNRTSVTRRAIDDAGFFAVNILGDDQTDLARQFARKGDDKFDDVELVRRETGAPLLAHALACFECRVTETTTGGTHTVFLAEVQDAFTREGNPLAYFRGKFGHLASDLVQNETYPHTVASA